MIDEFGNEIENAAEEAENAAAQAEEKINEAENTFEAAYEDAFSSGAQPEEQAEDAAEENAQDAAPEYEDVYSSSPEDEAAPAEQAENVTANTAYNPNAQGQPQGYAAPPVYGAGYYQPGANPQGAYRPPYGQGGYNQGGYAQGGYGQAGSYGQPGAYNQGYNPYPAGGYTAAPPAPKKKKTGRNIFIALVAVLLVIALLAGLASVIKKRGRRNESYTENGVSTAVYGEESGDDTELIINGENGGSKVTGDVLDPAEIAEIGRKSNVAVLIYSSGAVSKEAGQGSGIVMSYDSTGEYCYVITCAHVISHEGTSVKIQTEDGESYDAEVVGYDEKTDVGVIKVKTDKLEPAEFGDSDALKIGDPVYAIGNPGGVEFFGSFTAGHISAINRPISSEIGYSMKCIQHDAAINPGNSGGMLLNQYGQVVGINSQKIVKTDYEGMSFSIPISSAKVVIDDLIQYGYVKDRAKLSITYTSIRNSTQYYMIAQMNNLPQGTLIITGINTDSSLADTQVKKYDLIIAVNGEPLDTANTLLEKIDEGKIGDKMTLTICRVNSNYSVDQFDVEATLVEDKGNKVPVQQIEEPTEVPTTSYNPFDYFFGF